jgi:hypothetical protein
MRKMDDYIYISGALFASDTLDANRQHYERLGDACELAGHNAYIPHKHTDPEKTAAADPRDIYNIGSGKVIGAKGMILVADEPSFGAGMEMMEAAEHNLPILCVYRTSSRVSRYLRGFLMQYPYGKLLPYKSDDDLYEQLNTWLTETFPHRGDTIPQPKTKIIGT